MTAVAATRVRGSPVLVGDVVLSSPHGERIDDYAGKIYEVGTNVAIGWCGAARVAREAIGRLREKYRGRFLCNEELRRALGNLADLRGGPGLELTGWIVTAEGPMVIRWATGYEPSMLSCAENSLGDGGDELRKLLADPEVGGGNSAGYDTAPLTVISGFIQARFEEMLRPAWPSTWGAAYDVLLFQESRFRWLPSLTCVAWDVILDEEDGIIDVRQLPTVFKQERVHECTIMFSKELGASGYDVKLSTPIHRNDVDPAMFTQRPYSAVSPYYANYFRLFRRETFLVHMPLAVVNATRAGIMYHDGRDEEEPRFQVNRPNLERIAREMLQKHRALKAL